MRGTETVARFKPLEPDHVDLPPRELPQRGGSPCTEPYHTDFGVNIRHY
jgi:hypothetical protein